MGDSGSRTRPLGVEVITYAPTVFRHCQHCEIAFGQVGIADRAQRDEAAKALPPDLLDDFQRVSDWVHALLERHADRVKVTVVDAVSIEGSWKSLRHGVRRYPAVLVDGKRAGTDLAAVDRSIDARLAPERGAA
jgi:hypothetical protein